MSIRLSHLADPFVASYPTFARSCFVLGATGETGKRIVRNLINSAAFSRIKILSRRPVAAEFLPAVPSTVQIEQEIVEDFDSIAEDSEIFKGCEFGFCALGSTRAKAGSAEAFVKCDYEIPMKLLSLAKRSGCKYVALVSAAGSSPNSCFLYPKTKGQLERDLIALDFDALRIYRPALIRVKRQEGRWAEQISSIFAPILDFCSFGRAAVDIEVLADSIVKDALIYGANPEKAESLVIYDNKSIKTER